MGDFGKYIKDVRTERQESQEDVAYCLSVGSDFISKLENGHIYATKEHLFKLSSYFDHDINDMLVAYQKDRIFSEVKKGNRLSNTLISFKRNQNMKRTLSQLCKGQIQVKLHKPSYPLNSYIENIVYCKGHNLDNSFEKMLPDGSVQLIFNLDEHPRYVSTHGKEEKLRNVWVTGIQKNPMTYGLKPNAATLYIRFLPGGLYALTGIAQSEIGNPNLNAAHLLGNKIFELRDKILCSKRPIEIFQNIERFFMKFLAISQVDVEQEVIRYMIANIHLALDRLIPKTGYSQKHIIHLFKKHVGITPKYFQRICRFSNTLNQIQSQNGKMNWTAIAYENQFYDQAHFIKEFNHFSGTTPQSYIESGNTCSRVMHMKFM